MINLYAFTYPSAIAKFDGFVLVKIGDSTRESQIRIREQGGSAEYEAKEIIATWPNCKNIKRDFVLHRELKKRGLWHYEGNLGTEWFKIPGETVEDAHKYIDTLITDLEGNKVRKSVKLRKLQQAKLDEAMEIFSKGESLSTIIANLCPRFGKTIWSLSLFNAISEKYGNRVMLLPAYWLSVHSSFGKEIETFDDYLDIVEVTNEAEYDAAMANGQRVVLPVSLHGDLDAWNKKNSWISKIANSDIFMFADEGDFGTHADNQVEKLNSLFA